MTRIDIQNSIASTIKTATGADVEITIGHSTMRGDFLSVCGTVGNLDSARAIVEATGCARFVERDIDPDDDVQVDYYSI